MRKILICLLSFCLCLSVARAQTALQITEYTQQVMRQWQIPGLALAVIQGDSVVFSHGFGVKEKGGADPVSTETVFHIGSMTKAFTATLISSLVDRGLLSWNDTVCNILPDFRWHDPEVGARLQVRDLLTHRTGLVAQAGTYIPNMGYERDDIYQMFRYIAPMYGYGEKFAYNNITFIIAARVIEEVTGKSWEENLEETILHPLGMTASTPDTRGYLAAGPDASTAHYFGYHNGKIYVAPLRGEERALHWVDVIGPAGSICSNVEDMARWVRLHMRNGAMRVNIDPEGWTSSYPADSLALQEYFPEGPKSAAANFRYSPVSYYDQLISPSQMNFLHTETGHVLTDSLRTLDYGYCWYIEQNDRYRMLYHTGTTWGFTGVCGWVPDLDLGVVILCNSEVSEYARLGLMRRIVDLHLPSDSALRDWSSEGLQQWYRIKSKPARRSVPCTIARSRTVPEFSRLVGLYRKAEPFGDARITMKNGKLYLTLLKSSRTHRLDHQSGNEFHLRSDGHTFPIFFHNYTEGSTAPTDFEIDFNYNENFGPWIKER